MLVRINMSNMLNLNPFLPVMGCLYFIDLGFSVKGLKQKNPGYYSGVLGSYFFKIR
jgi:hypothetical protein